MYDWGGLNLPVPPVKTRSVPVLSYRHDGRVTVDTPIDTELCQTWPPLGPPNHPKKVAQNVLRVFPKGVKFTGVPGRGFPGKGSDIDKSPGAIHEPTPSRNCVDTGVGKPPQYVPRTLWNVFLPGSPSAASILALN